MSNTETNPPYVIGIDSSTQSTKGIVWDAKGFVVAEAHADIPMQNPGFHFFEQDASDWWRACVDVLHSLMAKVAPEQVVGLSISNQRETIAFLDKHFRSVRPAIVWLDERSRDEVHQVSDELGAENILRITGKNPDVTPVVYRLAWLKKHSPDVLRQSHKMTDVQGYLNYCLTGNLVTSWASADPLGLFDIVEKCWSARILNYLGLNPQQFPAVVGSGTMVGRVTAAASQLTGLPEGLAVYAGGGDGQCAGLATRITRPGQAYLNLGTAQVCGVWSEEYRCDTTFRTLTACSGGYILEMVLRTGAFLVNWLFSIVNKEGGDPRLLMKRLQHEAETVPIGSKGLLTLPYWSGVMTPYWNCDAHGAFIGLSSNHSRRHIYRSILEGLALEQTMEMRALEKSQRTQINDVFCIGGGANNPLWCQIFADCLGKPVHCLDTVEASCLGAGMIAAAGAGIYPSVKDAADGMGGHVVTSYQPIQANQQRYAELCDIYTPVYKNNEESFNRLSEFARKYREEE
ncbi:FGGY family carbohydrate kinase [Parasalinivibrio latis]|uniref:xylulokinase n=1 Tax=Parasalinivibrio latis TaxID=2952610 RepID=UPI0030E1C1AD